MLKNPQLCQCCDGAGRTPEVRYLWTPHVSNVALLTGKLLRCLVCEGTGVSPRADEWRKQNSYQAIEGM